MPIELNCHLPNTGAFILENPFSIDHRKEILAAVAAHQVLLISGETGCGKTTQIPQYILDHAWSNKQPCRILCTQPRRIAAIMVATRVAEERGEALGKTVGYRVMLDKVVGPESSLIYATTGIMLKDLTNVHRAGRHATPNGMF